MLQKVRRRGCKKGFITGLLALPARLGSPQVYPFDALWCSPNDAKIPALGRVKIPPITFRLNGRGQTIDPDTIEAGRPVEGNFDSSRTLRINEIPAVGTHIIESRESPVGLCRCGSALRFE